MVTLEEHIKILRELDALDPVTNATCRYFLLAMKDHYVDEDNTHLALNGKAGFVDSTGARMTVEDFFNAITTPEPPEPNRHKPLKAHAMPTVQRAPPKSVRGCVSLS